MNKIYKISFLILLIVMITGCSNITSSNAKKHLKEKYNEDFTYIEVLDDDGGLNDKEDSWVKYHFKSTNNNDIAVTCDENSCKDNYYSTLVREDMINFIGVVLSELNILSMDYKYYISEFDSCDNKIKKDTSIYDALKIDSYGLYTNISVYINENDYNNNFGNIDEKVKDVFKKYNLLGSLEINVLTNEDYIRMNTDSRKFIYDYITKNEVSTSATYYDIKETRVYHIVFNNEDYIYLK